VTAKRAALLICLALAACAQPPQVASFGPGSYPQRLSQWGVVVRMSNQLALGRDVVPYDLATPLFSDNAHKLRTVWLPPGTRARARPSTVFDLPIGTIISKTFYYPRDGGERIVITNDDKADFAGEGLDLAAVRLIETRLLIHQPGGWDALPYVWDADQSDAHLAITGDALRLTSTKDAFTYVVPSRNECASCHASDHTSGALQPIGLAARHLDKTYDHYASGPALQLTTWRERGLLDRLPGTGIRNAIWRPGAVDDLDRRARSYLDINCGHCHNPKGAADTSGLFLDRFTTDARAMGVCKPPVAAGRGSGGRAFAIVPGDPDASILVYRMASTDAAAMMPEIGRTTAHRDGVALVRAWVAALPGADCARSAPL
jgi:uncharacterized repeat protein (TIGR03806 family)